MTSDSNQTGIQNLPWLKEVLDCQYQQIYRGVIEEFLVGSSREHYDDHGQIKPEVLSDVNFRFVNTLKVQITPSKYFNDGDLIRVAKAITSLALDNIELVDGFD